MAGDHSLSSLPVHYDKIFAPTLFFSDCGHGLVSSGSHEGLASPATVSQWRVGVDGEFPRPYAVIGLEFSTSCVLQPLSKGYDLYPEYPISRIPVGCD